MKKLLITLNIFSISQLNNSNPIRYNEVDIDEIDNDIKEEESYDLVDEPPQIKYILI